MTSTWLALAQGYAGVIGFALFFLAPGFLLASSLNFNSFRSRSRAEKLLWSICLSLPLTVQICVTGGRFLSPSLVLALLIVLSAVASLTLVGSKRTTPIHETTHATRIVLALAVLLGLYLVFAVTDLQVGHHLYVSTVLYDWSVRVPMVNAAMRSGVPPVNGLSALDGHPAALRYFYFWYVVCADAARLLHLPARASLAASCVWASWALLSAFFLSLKYLLGVRAKLRLLCALSFAVLGVMGLDLLPTMALMASRAFHPYLEIEWWHQDRTPSLLGTAINSPHHLVAFASLLTGLLVLLLTLRSSEGPSPEVGRRFVAAALLAGVCFASAAGSSILATVVVTIACFVWALDLLRQSHLRTLAALAGSGVTALLLAWKFLRELQASDGSATTRFVSLRWRNYDFVRLYQAKYHLMGHGAVFDQVIAQSGVAVLHLFDLGFFLFVLIHQIRRDRRRELTVAERAMWALFAGTCLTYLFLSSASIASPNDLGFDAGLLIRLLLELWSVPWIYDLWRSLRKERPEGTTGEKLTVLQRIGLTLAAVCLVIGWCGQILQVVWERSYLPLVGSQIVRKQLDVLSTDHLSERLFNIRQAYRDLDRTPDVPSAYAPVQYNPVSPMQPALTFYSTHQIAAFDPGCGTGYGGDYPACVAIMPRLLALYGNTKAGVEHGRAGNDRQDGAAALGDRAEDGRAMCRELHLSFLIAESLDPVWARAESWVWTMPPVTTNETVRIVRCPTPLDEGTTDDNDPEDR